MHRVERSYDLQKLEKDIIKKLEHDEIKSEIKELREGRKNKFLEIFKRWGLKK
jgi:cell division protein FtsL